MPLYKNAQYSRIGDAAVGLTDVWIGEHYTSGTPVAGTGASTLYKAPIVANGTLFEIGRIGARFLDVTGGSEDSEIVFQVMRAGTALSTNEIAKFSATSMLFQLNNATGYLDGHFSFVRVGDSDLRVRSVGSNTYSALVAMNYNNDISAQTIYESLVAGTLFDIALARGSFFYGSRQTVIGAIAAEALTFGTNSQGRWQITSDGHLIAFDDNTYDFGASGATRPRTGYFGTSLIVAGVTTVAADITVNSSAGTVNAARLRNTTAGALTEVVGNLVAASTSADVEIKSTATRTAGRLASFMNASSERAAVSFHGIVAGYKGADVASNTTITLTGQSQDITGTTTIDGIVTTSIPIGAIVLLKFEASLTVTHNSGAPGANAVSMLLAGAANFAATADDVLTLWYDGTNWREVSRTVV